MSQMEDMTPEQSHALAQLQSITNGADDEVAISILQTVDWDVQRATDMIFESGSFSSPVKMEPLQLDDSQTRSHSSGHPWVPSGTRWLTFRPSLLLYTITFPFYLATGIVRFLVGVLRIPFPRFGLLNWYRPLPRSINTGMGGVERWVRELEEETGAVCISRWQAGFTHSSTTEAGPSSSHLTERRDVHATEDGEEGRKLLPDFCSGSYEAFLRTCQTMVKIGCIILVSEEHDDIAEFKRATLTDQMLVTLLYENEILVWGGDVRDKEAWSASQKLQATTYPFVAFIAPQPRRSLHALPLSSATSDTVLTILSRHAGPSTPVQNAPTSARTLSSYISSHILPRVQPFLTQMKHIEKERQRERQLRNQQDRAFLESANRDRDRIANLMRADREALEQRRQREAIEREETELKAAEKAALIQRKKERMDWRRWGRRMLVGREVGVKEGGTIRIAATLPRTGRVIRRFTDSSTLTELFVFVDSKMIPENMEQDHDPARPPNGADGVPVIILEQEVQMAGAAENWWGFKILHAYPRKEIPWCVGKLLKDVEGLGGGGQVVVEMVDRALWVDEAQSDSESDG